MGGDRDAPARRHAQRGVGGNDPDGAVERGREAIPLSDERTVGGDLRRWRRHQPELLGQVARPRQAGGRVDNVADAVVHHQRADRDVRGQHRRRGADAALEDPRATSRPADRAAAYPNSASGRSDQSPTVRSKTTAAGTIGTTLSPVPSSNRTPRRCSSSHLITPSAAARPYALPPVSSTASTSRTVLEGSSRSVSRVPCAPPRTSTEPTVPGGVSTTVLPVAQPDSRVASAHSR